MTHPSLAKRHFSFSFLLTTLFCVLSSAANAQSLVVRGERVFTVSNAIIENGVILVDNVLWDGHVADPEVKDEQTLALRNFNDHVARDPRVECVMLPIADGLTLLRKRG